MGNFSIIKRDKVPEISTILPVVWKILRTGYIKNRKVNTYKARLSLHGSRMKPGRYYDETKTH